jgi:hypothetical protein
MATAGAADFPALGRRVDGCSADPFASLANKLRIPPCEDLREQAGDIKWWGLLLQSRRFRRPQTWDTHVKMADRMSRVRFMGQILTG